MGWVFSFSFLPFVNWVVWVRRVYESEIKQVVIITTTVLSSSYYPHWCTSKFLYGYDYYTLCSETDDSLCYAL